MSAFQSSLIRGETYSLALEATEGDLTGATARADLKRAVSGKEPGDAALVAAAFAVEAVAEVTPDGGPGWIFTLTPVQTAALATGLYVMDARVTLASGFVDQVEGVKITVKERVTA
jgi:hypothetical protein